MTSEGLGRLAAADVPKLGSRIAGTRDEDVLVGTKGQARWRMLRRDVRLEQQPDKRDDLPHHITSVIVELDYPNAGLDIPQHAGHVARTGDNLAIVEEAAAAEVPRMGAKLPGTLDVVALFRVQVVN